MSLLMYLGLVIYDQLNVLRSCDYTLINVLRSCDLCLHCISTPPKCQDPRNIPKPPHPSHKVSALRINTPTTLTIQTRHLRILTYTFGDFTYVSCVSSGTEATL
jgi:hypothetical protein